MNVSTTPFATSSRSLRRLSERSCASRSSARIEPEVSITSTMSIPSVLTSVNARPVCGRITASRTRATTRSRRAETSRRAVSVRERGVRRAWPREEYATAALSPRRRRAVPSCRLPRVSGGRRRTLACLRILRGPRCRDEAQGLLPGALDLPGHRQMRRELDPVGGDQEALQAPCLRRLEPHQPAQPAQDLLGRQVGRVQSETALDVGSDDR